MDKGRLYITEESPEAYNRIRDAVMEVLSVLEVDPNDRNFVDTPHRVTKALLKEFTQPTFDWTCFDDEPYQGMITLHRHEVWTRCPHHLDRIKLIATVSYAPNENRIVGLSKLARLCDYIAAGCILQETYTRLLADKIETDLKPLGVGVYTVAHHQCMQARGVKTGAPVIMKDLRGTYFYSPQTRQEFLDDARRQ